MAFVFLDFPPALGMFKGFISSLDTCRFVVGIVAWSFQRCDELDVLDVVSLEVGLLLHSHGFM